MSAAGPAAGTAAYDARIASLREEEYPMLRGKLYGDQVYLDHAGTTLYAKSLMTQFTEDMMSNLYGNPHSAAASSQLSTARVEDVRQLVLQFFGADPARFDVVFVANATAGIKLVTEAFRGCPSGFDYLYHQACHTSLVGVRQEATKSLCVASDDVSRWIERTRLPGNLGSSRPLLFAYPAQSNMDGQRFPLDWSIRVRASTASAVNRVYTLLDAASYVSTSPLRLGDAESAPDFTVLSFYKIFGFPDLGALIVRREAAPVFQSRRYFGGGTVDMVVSIKEQWHASKTQSLHESLEDGSLPIHSIIALESALRVHPRLFGSMRDISKHTSYLASQLHQNLRRLHHGNGQPVCTVYPRDDQHDSSHLGLGPIVAFNLHTWSGSWVSLVEFEKLATLKRFHVRTGGVCNPGGIATALDLEPWELARNFSAGYRCGDENDILGGKPTGIIRVSFGAMSTLSDVEAFTAFVTEFYHTDQASSPREIGEVFDSHEKAEFYVDDVVVYPIKSCGGFHTPKGKRWDVRAEGLAWDREWCLVHRGSGKILTQKQNPRMALLRPAIDLDRGKMRISYQGQSPGDVLDPITIPLSADPRLFVAKKASMSSESRICGDDISLQIYASTVVNDFFSRAIGVPCALARFPVGGQGKSMRYAKAHLQAQSRAYEIEGKERPSKVPRLASYSEPALDPGQIRILLSNESPMLVISQASLKSLNAEILRKGGNPVSAEAFRANIVVGSRATTGESCAYSEDFWRTLRIGHLGFRILGSCRRCHMVCIDQETGIKSQEPFLTLSKTRRFEGKVFFGAHIEARLRPLRVSSDRI
ncbi:MOSC N-terminal beta barrel domain-containing protein [Thozetella sp. PMI_491]|nr:MOSC N-terminal beta barrel domain-containing protein [Thozetella sp. PMI_491]